MSTEVINGLPAAVEGAMKDELQSADDSIMAIPYRDVNDIRLLFRMTQAATILVLLLLLSITCNIWMYFRRPDRIVVDRTAAGDYVILANDKAVGSAVSFGIDQPGDGDKRALANRWCEARFAVDPLTRTKDIERLFKMMEPHAAKALSDLMKQNGELERERDENWQATWKPLSVTVDHDDPYRVDVIGLQEITRRVGGATQIQSRQLIFKLKLIADRDKGRDERNQNTGFLVFDLLDYKEVTIPASVSGSGLNAQSSVQSSVSVQ
ncbi:MAG TPA: hypothetical protein VFC63_21140 [Blastocatellia bacterium]|nr:hypothetical protein [Blastocatellia bacterium]